jgi:hypothetical protein
MQVGGSTPRSDSPAGSREAVPDRIAVVPEIGEEAVDCERPSMPSLECAVGIRMHSGWGTLVAISGRGAASAVIDRRRINTVDPRMPGAKQPYHHVAQAELPEAARYLEECGKVAQALAVGVLEETIEDLARRQYRLIGAALLLASGHRLPALGKILTSHALIHAAEGEFFRQAILEACRHLVIPVIGYRERELDEHIRAAFGASTGRLRRTIAGLGKSLGPPWTKDEKTATLAALLLLGDRAERRGR